jgi:VWFA-related protein
MRRLYRNMAAALSALLACAAAADEARAQKKDGGNGGGRIEVRRDVRTVTIPVTLHLPERLQAEVINLDELQVFEDGERQEILAIRGAGKSPMSLAVLIQDDLVSSVANEIKGLAKFIRGLPPDSRVMVGYLRGGSLQVRQKFTGDLERAAKALRIPASSTSVAPYNPYALTRDALRRFEAQPVGRRALLLVSDGLDTSRGPESSTPATSLDLQRAINEAQRRGVAVYSIYAPTVWGSSRLLAGNGQGSLNRLSEETGGRAFFQGMGAPTSFDHYLEDISAMLSRQFALTYLSTHPEKGFHRVRVVTEVSEGEVYHPSGYTR